MCVYYIVCVWKRERQRENERVCMLHIECMWKREREKERECEGVEELTIYFTF